MNKEQIQEFVEANKVALTEQNKFSRCVDGRYEHNTDYPMIAKPGGDAGDIMTIISALNILNVNVEEQKIVDLVIQELGGAEYFNFHTDDHADPNVPGIGCGHLKQAKLDPIAYGLEQEQIDFIFAELPSLLSQGSHQEVLHGDHAEQAVFVVDSEAYGLLPMTTENSEVQEVFVYQKTLHMQQLKNFATKLHSMLLEEGHAFEEHEILKALDDAFSKQLTETLGRLAKGLPVFIVKISETGEVEIIE